MATYEKMFLTSNFDSFLSKTCPDDKKSDPGKIFSLKVHLEKVYLLRIGPKFVGLPLQKIQKKDLNFRQKYIGFLSTDLKLHNWYCHNVQTLSKMASQDWQVTAPLLKTNPYLARFKLNCSNGRTTFKKIVNFPTIEILEEDNHIDSERFQVR